MQRLGAICLIFLALACRAADNTVLARVAMTAAVPASGLAVYELLQDAKGQDYALVLAPVAALRASGCTFEVLATNAAPQEFVIARTFRPATHAQLALLPECIYDDGRHVILRGTAALMARRTDYDAILRSLPQTPLRWDAPPRTARRAAAFTCVSNAAVAAMIRQVDSNRIWWLTAQLSGETNLVVGTNTYSIYSRNTRYGVPYQKDAAFIFQTMTNLQYQTRYFNWSTWGYISSNVIATKTGTTRANETVLLIAHLDNMPSSGRAPGADDNGSGCVALLLAAEQLIPQVFERTLQLVFATGEEQGLLGSAAYAAALTTQVANVVAVYNFDMIAWSTLAPASFGVHTRVTSHPQFATDLVLAQLYTNVMATYGLAGAAASIVADGETASDHSSFWDVGYPAVLTIENLDDFNAYYHTANDRLQNCNLAYYTTIVKGAVGTAAHAAQLVPEPGSLLYAAFMCMLWRLRAVTHAYSPR
ncbi:MAG: M20/M25/M40 family metallo-hydrolase [bacterium]|nr:M20/M25/M40 family metallo-hydrolase [bacterium]